MVLLEIKALNLKCSLSHNVIKPPLPEKEAIQEPAASLKDIYVDLFNFAFSSYGEVLEFQSDQTLSRLEFTASQLDRCDSLYSCPKVNRRPAVKDQMLLVLLLVPGLTAYNWT